MRHEDSVRHALDVLPRIFKERLGRDLIPARPDHDDRLRQPHRFDLAFEIEGLPRAPLVVEVKPRALSSELLQFAERSRELAEREEIPLLFVPRLSARIRQQLRDQKLNHADAGGTLYIRARDLVVDLESSGWDSGSPRDARNVNPFSDKASLVLRVLFERPRRPWRVTEIAERAQLTKGWVSVVAKELVERGFASETSKGLELGGAEAALDEWSAYYRWSRNRIQPYVAPFGYPELLSRLSRIAEVRKGAALTLFAGADQVAPFVQQEKVHLYVSSPADLTLSALQDNLFLERIQTGGNLVLASPYYSQSAFFGIRFMNDLPVVSDVQLYLDLASSPSRGREASEIILRSLLRP